MMLHEHIDDNITLNQVYHVTARLLEEMLYSVNSSFIRNRTMHYNLLSFFLMLTVHSFDNCVVGDLTEFQLSHLIRDFNFCVILQDNSSRQNLDDGFKTGYLEEKERKREKMRGFEKKRDLIWFGFIANRLL